MFSDRTTCIRMLEGSYRKLKSYYYYNKDYFIIKEKIARFEADRNNMDISFKKLHQLLTDSDSNESSAYFQDLLDQLDFCALPKKFESEKPKAEYITTNVISKDKKLRSVNLFVELPIELFILDTLWTLLLGKISAERQILSNDVYGNTLANHILYGNAKNADSVYDTINFQSTRLFNIYFHKYSAWRNNAFSALESNYSQNKNSVLLSLDIQSYYYNVRFDFNLQELLGKHALIEPMNMLTTLIKRIYMKYFDVTKAYRKGFEQFNEGEYPLPIGLFSSMLIANLYLTKFDKKMEEIPSCSYYGRYVDDLLFCFVTDDETEIELTQIIKNNLVDNDILVKISDNSYELSGFPNLLIQKEKVKVVHISSSESRVLLDIYNEKVRIIPSQMRVLPDYDLQPEDFNESAYTIEYFGKEFKIRDIGNVNIDAFNVSRYFSVLSYKQGNINPSDNDSKESIATIWNMTMMCPLPA